MAVCDRLSVNWVFKNLGGKMKRTIILAVLAVLVTLPHSSLAQETNQRIAVSPAFATAQEAVNFANSLPAGSEVRFTCEYRAGTPTESFFKVVYVPSAKIGLNFEWDYKELEPPKEAADFVNNNGSMPSYAPCWNPSRNPAGTNTVVFYNKTWRGISLDAYGPFANTQLAVSWINKNACNKYIADFVSVTNTLNQVEPIWYVITEKNLDHCSIELDKGSNWQVLTTTKDTESAVAFANNYPYISGQEQLTIALYLGTIRLASAFNTWDITGRIVLFALKPTEESEPIKDNEQEQETEPKKDTPKENDTGDTAQNKPELILPIRIFATKTLLDKSASKRLQEITNVAADYFHEQINFVRLETSAEIQEAPQIVSSDPLILGNSLPYVKNTLAIFFTDQNLLIPATDSESERNISGRAGRSWVVVNVNVCDGCKIKPESVLLHEILHEFGVPHKQDPTSVMCKGLIIKDCPPNIMTIDGKSLAEVKGAVKAIKKIGFDTYTGLATRF